MYQLSLTSSEYYELVNASRKQKLFLEELQIAVNTFSDDSFVSSSLEDIRSILTKLQSITFTNEDFQAVAES